jgi:hypothetical protein
VLGFVTMTVSGARVLYDFDGPAYNYAFFIAITILFLSSLIGYFLVKRNFRSVKYAGFLLCFAAEILIWSSNYFYDDFHEYRAYYDIARSAFWQLIYFQLLNTNFVLSQYIGSSSFFSTNMIKLLLEKGDNPTEASIIFFVAIVM